MWQSSYISYVKIFWDEAGWFLSIKIFRLLTSYCYNHNVSADMSFDLLHAFHVELSSLLRTWNWTLYLIHGVDCFISLNHDWAQVLNYNKYFFVILTCSWDWSYNLQMISFRSTSQLNALFTVPCVLARQFKENFWDL